MKTRFPFWTLFCLITACDYPVVHSLPEPELEVRTIVFDTAEYDETNKNIVLTFQEPYPAGAYTGIFGTYNKQEIFRIEDYLRDWDAAVEYTSYYYNRLVIELMETETDCPARMVFNREKPCYFYKTRQYRDRGYNIIEAKAFIVTEELTIGRPSP
jgi:hypothetical protein